MRVKGFEQLHTVFIQFQILCVAVAVGSDGIISFSPKKQLFVFKGTSQVCLNAPNTNATITILLRYVEVQL